MITEHKVHFLTGSRTKKKLVTGEKPTAQPGRIPRVSKMMALAIRFDQLIREGKVKNQAELARLGHVSRARLSQIMLLLQLAPDIQEALLFLPIGLHGKLIEREIRDIAINIEWDLQRNHCRSLNMLLG